MKRLTVDIVKCVCLRLNILAENMIREKKAKQVNNLVKHAFAGHQPYSYRRAFRQV